MQRRDMFKGLGGAAVLGSIAATPASAQSEAATQVPLSVPMPGNGAW
jgi:hypothetical protein